jgi:signal transduction histidine kinase
MASKTLTTLSVERETGSLNDVFERIDEAAVELRADPKWASVSRLLSRTAEQGRSIANALTQPKGQGCELEAVVDCAIQFASDVLRAQQINGIEFYRDVEAGIRLPGPAACWERALLQLLINAGEAMKRGGVVEVCARREGDRLNITVADNGPSIPQEALAHVFWPNAPVRRGVAGMGLHQVESIVRRNGGRITAANRAGAPGAEFCISLPA